MMLTFNRQTLPFRTEFVVAGTRCVLATNSLEVLLHSKWKCSSIQRWTIGRTKRHSFEATDISYLRSSRPAVSSLTISCDDVFMAYSRSLLRVIVSFGTTCYFPLRLGCSVQP